MGYMLLVEVDAHSKWPEEALMKSTNIEKTIEKLKGMFTRFGRLEQIASGNGPQFTSQEFEDYSRGVVSNISN